MDRTALSLHNERLGRKSRPRAASDVPAPAGRERPAARRPALRLGPKFAAIAARIMKLHPWRVAVLALGLVLPSSAEALAASRFDLDVLHWRIVRGESGPVDYYETVNDPAMPFVRARYRPPLKTAVLGLEIRKEDRKAARAIHWQWRAVTLPTGGDECVQGKTDSAAVVYLTWKRGFRWYTLKYVWSSVGRAGDVCGRQRNLFVAQDTIVLESAGPLGVWRSEDLDIRREFRNHFEDGNPNGDVPDFVGVGIMSDGDQTKTESAADYADFVLVR
ncbi:MAG: DUF3047 domain-containing protein [Polyangiaceae bacterium]